MGTSMYKQRMGLLIVIFFAFISSAWANSDQPIWFNKTPDNQIHLRVDLFLSTDCPHCQQADKFFNEISKNIPWVEQHRHYINKDKPALELFNQYLQQKHAPDFMVPSIFFCDTRWMGFQNADNSGEALMKGLNYCRDMITKEGKITPATQQILTQMGYEAGLMKKPSALSFTAFMVFLDLVSYTAIYSVMTLFAFMIVQHSRRGLVVTALVYLMGTGIAHHIQQAHTLLFYKILAYIHWPIALLGALLILSVVVFHRRGLAKAHHMTSFAALLLTLAIAMVVQLCQQQAMPDFKPDFSVIYNTWLQNKDLSSAWYEVFNLVYQIFYVAVIAFFSLLLLVICRWRKSPATQNFMEEFGWAWLIIIGLILILAPMLFTEGLFAIIGIILASIATWLGYKTWLK